jgi:hypothetical protein
MLQVIEFEDGCKIINNYNDYSPDEATKAHEKILSDLYKLFSQRADILL